MDTKIIEKAILAVESAGKSGIFLNTLGDRPNSMTIGWCQTGIMWRLPVFIVVVRHSRYSHELLQKHGEFTVSVPHEGKMREALSLCGSKSGRDLDKAAASGLIWQDAKSVKVPVIADCAQTIECRLLGAFDMNLETFDEELSKRFYADNDVHTICYGEILEVY